MIQQDNIKHFAIAAFRFKGHLDKSTVLTAEELEVLLAVSATIRHFKVEHDYITVQGIEEVYFKLPLGNLKRGTMTNRIRRIATDMHIDERTLYYKLSHARSVFDEYYKEFIQKSFQ